MKLLKQENLTFTAFLLVFFVLNIIQSAVTGLLEDEAYYWVWSNDLAWGYFDHPPLVALWIWIGDRFFSGELGVRFFSALSFSVMLIVIWKMIDVKSKNRYIWLFFLLVISMAMINLYGFIATPDTPLLLFVSVFLYYYKGFLKNGSVVNIIGLGIAMAGMLYSKYHGILVILFVLISHLSLLRNKRFWMASVLGFLLFLPHLIWQYKHDFPTFRYHLFERNPGPYRFEYTLMHFVNLIAIVGITFPLIYKAFFKEKTRDLFDKALKFLVYGFAIFFFFGSFKSPTQAQWSVVILIPLLLFAFRYFVHHKKQRKILMYVGSVQLLILLAGRVFLAKAEWSPVFLETHKPGIWVEQLRKKTQSKPLVFMNHAYQDASVYRFYTGIQTHAYSTLYNRKSQYDIGDFETRMQQKDVDVISSSKIGDFILLKGDKKLYRKAIARYHTFQKVKLRTVHPGPLLFEPGKEKTLRLLIRNPYKKEINFDTAEMVGFLYNRKSKQRKEIPLEYERIGPIEAGGEREILIRFTVPDFDYNTDTRFRPGLKFYGLGPGFQGKPLIVKIKE